jgi:hypothetical protein
MRFDFFIKPKHQPLKDAAPDRRVGNNKHNTTNKVLNNVINKDAASNFCTCNIDITKANGLEKPETANVDNKRL